MSLSPRLSSRIWAIQKEIKDAYPKNVCHMPKRHDNEKKEKRCIPKEGMPHVHKTCQKKGEKKEEEKYMYIYIAHDQEKNTKREREIDHPMEFIRYPPKIFHTFAPLDQVV